MSYKEEQEFYWNLIFFEETIQKKLPMIKEKFVEFYGEKYREKIEKKLDNLYIVAYNRPKEVERNINLYLSSLSHQLQDEFLEEASKCTFSSAFDKSLLEKTDANKEIYFNHYNFTYRNSIPLESLFTSIKNEEQGITNSYFLKKEVTDLINKIYATDYTEEEITNCFSTYKQDFKILENLYNKAIEKFNKQTNKLQPKITYFQEMNKLSCKQREEEYRNYFALISDILNKEDQKLIDKQTDYNFFALEGYKTLFEYNLLYPSLIDDFYNYYDEFVSNKEIKDGQLLYKKSQIDDYFEDENGNIKYPSKERLEQVISLREQSKNKIIDYAIMIDPILKQHLENITSMPLLNKSTFFTRETFRENGVLVDPNVIEKENGMELFSLLFISSALCPEDIDQFLYHELNHVNETELLDIKEEKFSFNTGMDYVENEIKNEWNFDEKTDSDNREYELLSEITNELISQEFHQFCLDTGFTVINTKANSKVKGTTSYERLRVFVEPYYDHFKENIKDARMDYNSSAPFYSKVGYENLKQLNKVIHTFLNDFEGGNYYHLLDKISNKENDQEVEHFYDLVKESRQIYNHMLASEQTYNENHTKGV